jgi:hypothetical protein
MLFDGRGGGFVISDPRRAASSEALRFGFIKSQLNAIQYHNITIS